MIPQIFYIRRDNTHDCAIDKLKAAARQQAWYPDPDGKPNYNPFRKIQTRAAHSSSHDLELGSRPGPLNHVGTYHSVDAVERTSDINRRSEYEPDQVGARHANTMPPQALGSINPQLRDEKTQSSSTDPSTDRHSLTDEKQTPSVNRKDDGEDSTTTHGTPDTLVSHSDPVIGSGQTLTRRSRFIGRFSKRHPESGDVPDENGAATEDSPPPQKFTLGSQLKATIFNSWINLLLIAAPVGIALNYAKVPPIVVFVVNFIAIIPLAAMLSYATEEIALRTGETLGGLLNATFGYV